MTTSHPAAQLLQFLFQTDPDGAYLEVRLIEPGLLSKRLRFVLLCLLRQDDFSQAVPTSLSGRINMYYSMLPRSCPSGRSADVDLAIGRGIDKVAI